MQCDIWHLTLGILPTTFPLVTLWLSCIQMAPNVFWQNICKPSSFDPVTKWLNKLSTDLIFCQQNFTRNILGKTTINQYVYLGNIVQVRIHIPPKLHYTHTTFCILLIFSEIFKQYGSVEYFLSILIHYDTPHGRYVLFLKNVLLINNICMFDWKKSDICKKWLTSRQGITSNVMSKMYTKLLIFFQVSCFGKP